MKASELTLNDIKGFCGITDNSLTTNTILTTLKSSAMAYISSYCGLSEPEIDDYDELSLAVLMFVYSNFENRSSNSESQMSENPAFISILNLHRRNFL